VSDVCSLENICPETDPDSMPFYATEVQGISSYYASCTTVMATATCTTSPIEMPVPTYGTIGQFYPPGQIPVAGTAALSDTPGSLTAPPSGSVLTWSLYSGTALTASAASLNPSNQAVASSSSGGSASHSSAATATASEGFSAAATTSTGTAASTQTGSTSGSTTRIVGGGDFSLKLVGAGVFICAALGLI